MGKKLKETNLKDVNGNVIKEGDYLKDISGKIDIPIWVEEVHGELFVYALGMDEYFELSELLNPYGDCPFEVIGNVIENPKLKKKAVNDALHNERH